MTDSTPRLPSWPPPDGKISVDEARQIIAWIREHAGPVLEEAERMLRARYPSAEIHRSAMTVGRADAHHEGAVHRDDLVFLYGRLICDGRYLARPGGAARDQAGDEHAVRRPKGSPAAVECRGQPRQDSPTIKRHLDAHGHRAGHGV